MTLTVGALFAGMSGLELGLSRVLPTKLAWVSEIDPAASKVLAHRFPDVPNLGDITAVDWTRVERVDVLTGGYPCQPFSNAGRRMGSNDMRHLWPYVVDAVSEMRPRLCVFENVRGHLTLGFDSVLGDLKDLGYEARWTVLKASDIGAPHQRARIFIVAEDKYGRQLCGWDHRRGRVHTAISVTKWSGDGAGGGHDDLQGVASAAETSCAVRREVCSHEARSTSDACRCAFLETDRPAVPAVSEENTLTSSDQAGAGRFGHLVSGADRQDTPSGWQGRAVVGGIEGDSGSGAFTYGGTQSHWTPTPDGSGTGSLCDLGDGSVGEAPNDHRSVTGGARRAVADERDDARRDCLQPASSIDSIVAPSPASSPFVGSVRCGPAWGGGHGPAHGGITVADTQGDGWDEGRPEPAGQLGGFDAALGGAGAATHAGGAGLEGWTATGRPVDASPSQGRRGDVGPVQRGDVDWGPYGPAIERWEAVLGRIAPAPTELGAKGGQRLSPAFVEWMMGLPAGWVTDVPGLSRNDQLKILGNGVVPQQCAAAVASLLPYVGARQAAA